MYKNLKEQLMGAEAESQFVIAINIDIRGFTDFCRRSDTAEVALLIRTIYLKIINEYFPDVDFCKPTGDGMMIVIPYENHFREKINDVVNTCLELRTAFESFCNDDVKIYFSVPDKIGIGISRGNACCIKANGNIIDYSGQVLNVANRLMDIARPEGIIVENNFDISILNENDLFEPDSVYLIGVAEKESIDIFCQKDSVMITAFNKNPIGIYDWTTVSRKIESNKISTHAVSYSINLENEPYSEDAIIVQLFWEDKSSGAVIDGIYNKDEYKLEKIGNNYRMKINYNLIRKVIESEAIAKDSVVTTVVTYPV